MSTPTAFELFAQDHKQHQHCVGCGGCLLRPDLRDMQRPFWCVSCAVRLCKTVPVGVPLPFEGAGQFLAQEVVDAYCDRKVKELPRAARGREAQP
jgi:hypothetical protein